MGKKSLKDDLANSIITFNQRVLLTDLMDEYELPFTEIENYVQAHIDEQEKSSCLKCEKRYLVNGKLGGNEIYTVVPQEQMDVWLKKLKETECKLYSVELVGGSKTAAQEVKPMRFCTIGHKDSKKATNSNNDNIDAKKEIKKPAVSQVKNEINTTKEVLPKKQEAMNNFHKAKTSSKQEEKQVLEKKKTSPSENKNNKKPLKDKDQIVKKPSSPKRVNDFFKNNAKQTPQKKLEANSSMQLFVDDEDVLQAKAAIATEVSSSDEEEMLDAMRRKITHNDNEEEEEDKHATGGPKRRRILDSDDDEDEQPQAKQEKQEKPTATKSETYLDEDGFVLTIKPKKAAVAATVKPSNKKISPPAKKSSPMKSQSKNPKKPPPKTKQGNITSFFTKK